MTREEHKLAVQYAATSIKNKFDAGEVKLGDIEVEIVFWVAELGNYKEAWERILSHHGTRVSGLREKFLRIAGRAGVPVTIYMKKSRKQRPSFLARLVALFGR